MSNDTQPSTMEALRRGWRETWHAKADNLRAGWSRYVSDWEADTEVGYPLTASASARRDLGLAIADMCDAIGGPR